MEVSMLLPTKLPNEKDNINILDGYYIVACREELANEWMDYERTPVPSTLSYAQAKLKELNESLNKSKWSSIEHRLAQRGAPYIIIKVDGSDTKFNEDQSKQQPTILKENKQ